MQLPEFKSFRGKVLLFGEYLVIQGEKALAIPIQNFQGRLMLKDSFQEDNIAPFIQYLGALPLGYGAGSSGALTAAVYDAFVLKHDGSLQEALGSMEDYFHGSSSGLDPLVSYTGEATLPIDRRALKHFYLLDTDISRKTGPFVEIFKKKLADHSFDDLASLNVSAMKEMGAYNLLTLGQIMTEISAYQFEHFAEMIPAGFKEIWKSSMGMQGLSIKLCGAGGGGFLLMFSEEENKLEEFCEKWDLQWIKIEY